MSKTDAAGHDRKRRTARWWCMKCHDEQAISQMRESARGFGCGRKHDFSMPEASDHAKGTELEDGKRHEHADRNRT